MPASRVVLIGLTGLTREIVRAVVSSASHARVVGELAGVPSPVALAPANVDVVIGAESDVEAGIDALFERWPHARILSLAGDGATALIAELVLSEHEITASPTTLAAELKSSAAAGTWPRPE